MGLREKVALMLMAVIIIQIKTSHCVPLVSKKDTLQRYLDARGIKTTNAPFITNNYNVKMKNAPDSLYKEMEDLRKDMRMKRKLDSYQTSGTGTTLAKSLSGPQSIIQTDKGMFPEVQYPVNIIDTWSPNKWNPSMFSQDEFQNKPSEFPIFNPKVSEKSNQSFAPYKKQKKSKVQQFMEEIDILNEKRHNSTTQSKKPQELDKNLSAISNNFKDLMKPESNGSELFLDDLEPLQNTTTEVSLSKNLENQDIKDQSIALYPTNNLSPQRITSEMKSDIPDVIPLPYKTHEENNPGPKMKDNSVKDEDTYTYLEEINSSLSKINNITSTPQHSNVEKPIEEFELPIPLSTVNLTVGPEQQPTGITESITTDMSNNKQTESLVQNNNEKALISNDDPFNVHIPLPEVDIHGKTPIDQPLQNISHFSNDNRAPRTTIIMVPVDDQMNMMQIPIYEENTGSSIILLMPTSKTSTNTFHTSPLIAETEIDIPGTKSLTPGFEMLPNNSMCHVSPNEVKSQNMTIQHFNGTDLTGTILRTPESSYNALYSCSNNNIIGQTSQEALLQNTTNVNTLPSLTNGRLSNEPSDSVLDFIETVVNTSSSQFNADEAGLTIENAFKNYTYLQHNENRVPFPLVDVYPISRHIYPNNNGNSELNPLGVIHKEAVTQFVDAPFTDYIERIPVLPMDKSSSETSINDLPKNVQVLTDGQLDNLSNDTDIQDTSQLYNKEKTLSEEESSERNVDLLISKHIQTPIQEVSNNSLKTVTYAVDSHSYDHINNSYVTSTEEEDVSLPENDQTLSVPVAYIYKDELPMFEEETSSESRLSERNENDHTLLKDETLPNESNNI